MQKKAEKSTLSANQKKALPAILAEKNIRTAALVCGLSERTLFKYLLEPAFLEELQEQQSAIYSGATARLTSGIDTALDELYGLVTGAKSEAVQRQAIENWLHYSLKLRESVSLEERIIALEEGIK